MFEKMKQKYRILCKKNEEIKRNIFHVIIPTGILFEYFLQSYCKLTARIAAPSCGRMHSDGRFNAATWRNRNSHHSFRFTVFLFIKHSSVKYIYDMFTIQLLVYFRECI